MKWTTGVTVVIEHQPVGFDLDKHLTEVMDELVRLDADPDLTATLARGIVEIEVAVEAEAPDGALRGGLATIRSALHAAGGATPGWPDVPDGEQIGHWAAHLAAMDTRAPSLLDA